MVTTQQYIARRKALLDKVPDSSILVIFGAKRQHKSADQHFPFWQLGNFYYLSGWQEPDAILVMSKNRGIESTLYHVGENSHDARWHGRNISHTAAQTEHGFDDARPLKAFPEWLERQNQQYQSVFTLDAPADFLARQQLTKAGEIDQLTLAQHLTAMRLVKTNEEIELMREAGRITARAHKDTMRASAEHTFSNERQIAASFQYYAQMNGASGLAYDSIAAAGANACTLHYTKNNSKINPDECVLLDAGCHIDHYCADVTRTWPVAGKFSAEQKAVYDVVMAAHSSCLQMLKPGVRFSEIHSHSQKLLVDGLKHIGVIKKSCDPQAAFEAFYGHAIGHSLGLDVHDPSPSREQFSLESNVVVTIEPGLYLSKSEHLEDDRFLGIGVRIEDNIRVLDEGIENFTENAPVEITDIENLMSA
jgi:Xaa-Pro aminopeptidase